MGHADVDQRRAEEHDQRVGAPAHQPHHDHQCRYPGGPGLLAVPEHAGVGDAAPKGVHDEAGGAPEARSGGGPRHSRLNEHRRVRDVHRLDGESRRLRRILRARGSLSRRGDNGVGDGWSSRDGVASVEPRAGTVPPGPLAVLVGGEVDGQVHPADHRERQEKREDGVDDGEYGDVSFCDEGEKRDGLSIAGGPDGEAGDVVEEAAGNAPQAAKTPGGGDHEAAPGVVDMRVVVERVDDGVVLVYGNQQHGHD